MEGGMWKMCVMEVCVERVGGKGVNVYVEWVETEGVESINGGI